MFNDKKEILKKVYELARDRHIQYNLNNKKEGIIDLMSIEDIEWSEEEKALDSYLNTLDFEDVKMIQTIMYLGRDKDYNRSSMPEEIYRENREYMDNLGWTEKYIEVNQIVEKLPLDKYLENGLKILNIKL